jgi:hypothetical protein
MTIDLDKLEAKLRTSNVLWFDDIDELFRLARIGEKVQWRPIKDAPRDGTTVDICLSSINHVGGVKFRPQGRISNCIWDEELQAWNDGETTFSEDYDISLLSDDTHGLVVTHFIPLSALPEPPK